MASYSQDFPFGIMDVVELLHLRVRWEKSRGQRTNAYVDCPFCGDRRGKMNVNFVKNVWRCNYCGEYGGMLSLYARLNNTTTSDAYREICDALQTGDVFWNDGKQNEKNRDSGASERKSLDDADLSSQNKQGIEEIAQSSRASAQEIHQTFSLLFEMLSLKPAHREHLRSEKRGLSDEQIEECGFKSTPPYFLCRSLTERLINQGCTVQGVPGFYVDKKGNWTVKFNSRTSGILIPAIGIDGLIHGAQILLDVPIKDKDDPPDKSGTKYIWLSSSSKHMGVTSGSPVHFVGNPFSRTIYVTEGLLKADIAHYLMNRSFVAIAGANNVAQLDPLFALLAQNGTELIVEAHDIDKYSNEMTAKGCSKIYLSAKKNGIESKRLTWNPNYKGIDDWQLALRREEQIRKEIKLMSFKKKYLLGLCNMAQIGDYVEQWYGKTDTGQALMEHLGLSEEEYAAYCQGGKEELGKLLDKECQRRNFRIYQLDMEGENKTIPFAFRGIQRLFDAGYEQPPAGEYCLVTEGELISPAEQDMTESLKQLRKYYRFLMSPNYEGHPLAPSDVVELHDGEGRHYFYVDLEGFESVRFSPFLAKPFQNNKKEENIKN